MNKVKGTRGQISYPKTCAFCLFLPQINKLKVTRNMMNDWMNTKHRVLADLQWMLWMISFKKPATFAWAMLWSSDDESHLLNLATMTSCKPTTVKLNALSVCNIDVVHHSKIDPCFCWNVYVCNVFYIQ